jgi:hypothetical protein
MGSVLSNRSMPNLSISLAQIVIEHGSATVGFEHYRPVLERVLTLLPSQSTVTLLADRGFEHGELIRWLQRNQWSWAIRAKSDFTLRYNQKRRTTNSPP